MTQIEMIERQGFMTAMICSDSIDSCCTCREQDDADDDLAEEKHGKTQNSRGACQFC